MPEKNYPTIEELKEKTVAHGNLVGCSYSASSSGMMYNSNALYYISVDADDEGQLITLRRKQSLQNETQSTYRSAADILALINALAERENMPAWGELEYRQEYVVFDYSQSEGLTLYYDDTPTGGYKKTPVNINAQAVRQQGRGDVIKEFVDILEKGIDNAEVIEEAAPTPPAPDMRGLMLFKDIDNTPKAEPKEPAPGCWCCPCCGCVTNTGRFCCECGSKRPQE